MCGELQPFSFPPKLGGGILPSSAVRDAQGPLTQQAPLAVTPHSSRFYSLVSHALSPSLTGETKIAEQGVRMGGVGGIMKVRFGGFGVSAIVQLQSTLQTLCWLDQT